MILRRVTEHVKAQNWLAVGLDFIIVVMGVFMGIQVSNWNQSVFDQKSEADYLEQLQRDLQDTQLVVREQIVFEHFQADLAGAVFKMISEAPSADKGRRIGMGLAELGARRTLRVESPTILEMQGAGNLGIISDQNLRAAIIAYSFYTRRLESAIDKNNEYYIDQGFNDFVRNAGIQFRIWDDAIMGQQLPQTMQLMTESDQGKTIPPLFNADDILTTSPPDAKIWTEIVPQLSWRAGISRANKALAHQLMNATRELDEKISQYRERERS